MRPCAAAWYKAFEIEIGRPFKIRPKWKRVRVGTAPCRDPQHISCCGVHEVWTNLIDPTHPQTELAMIWRRLEIGAQVSPSDFRLLWSTYLESEHWQRRRLIILRRNGGWCESCKKNAATEVDHLTYNHRFDEYPDELMAVCRGCHQALSESRGQVKAQR